MNATYELPTDTSSLEELLERTQQALRDARRAEAEAARAAAAEAAAAALANSERTRFFAAVKALRKQGLKWHTNVMKCCRGCVEASQLGVTDDDTTTPVGWTFGGQGSAIKWDDKGKAYERDDRWRYGRQEPRPVVAYVNHSNGAGEMIAKAFRDNGFTVEWNGSDSQCVMVTLTAEAGAL